MSDYSIIDAIEDKKLFRPLFKDMETWEAWLVFLKAVFALPLDAAELDLYRKCTGRQDPPAHPCPEVYAIVGRRGGKSFMAAVIACYLALFHDWRQYLSPGETAWVMVIATDRDQARNILQYIKGILKSSRMLGQEVESDNAWEVLLRNQIGIKIGTCSYRTLRGYTVVAAVCDEVAFWRMEGSNPASEVLNAIRPSLATIPGGMIFGISSPYSKSGVLYEAYRDKWGKDGEEVLVWQAPTLLMNPTIKERVIDRAMKEDASAARSEWMAEFRDDLETYLSSEAIQAVIPPGRTMLPKTRFGSGYKAFVDPSGGRRDSFTLGIGHREGNGRIVLDRLEERRPPLTPQGVVDEFSGILNSYGIKSVKGDRYGGDWPVAAFRKNGIAYRSSELNKSEIYMEFLPLVMQREVELLDFKRLIEQLRGLERRTRAGGKDSVDHYPGGSDDVANAAAGVCVSLKGARDSVWTIAEDERPPIWASTPLDPATPYPECLDGMEEGELREWIRRLEKEVMAAKEGWLNAAQG